MARGRRDSPVSFFSFQDVMVCTIGLTLLITLLLILQVGTSVAEASARLDPSPVDATPEVEARAEQADRLRRRLAELEAREAVDPNQELARIRARLRELDGELRRLRGEMGVADEELAAALRSGSLDADEAIAEALLARRDRLKEDLAAVEVRRRIVYLVANDEPHPPTVAELSGGRSIISFDQEREAPIALAAPTPQAEARRILEVFTSRDDWRERTLLVVLKPSGTATYRALLEAIAADPAYAEVVLGLDLIGEDRWTSDAFPTPRRRDESAPRGDAP